VTHQDQLIIKQGSIVDLVGSYVRQSHDSRRSEGLIEKYQQDLFAIVFLRDEKWTFIGHEQIDAVLLIGKWYRRCGENEWKQQKNDRAQTFPPSLPAMI